MNLQTAIVALLMSGVVTQATSASAVKENSSPIGGLRKRNDDTRRLMTSACVLLEKKITMEGSQPDIEDVECLDLSTGYIASIKGPHSHSIINEILTMFRSGMATSNESTLMQVDASYDADGNLFLPNNDVTISNTDNVPSRRKLAVNGMKTMLALRVEADDASTTSTAGQISDAWFGTDVDAVNFKSQTEACSYGKVEVQAGTFTSPSISNGVHTVNISDTVSGVADSIIREAAVRQAETDLGVSPLGNAFDYVMVCVPPGTSGGWIAYAYVNHWLSVYNNQWCNYVSGQIHEIGHNMGLAHSGETATYDDQSGMMGYSYSGSDAPLMCFNAAKNWQLGWYDDRQRIISSGETWTGKVYGISDYGNTNTGDTVIVQIPGTSFDWYVSFNRKVGINSGTKEGGNQVLVHRRNKGVAYGESDLMAKLNAGGTYSSAPLPIKVNSINLPTNSGFASITIGTASVTSTPTSVPTTTPTRVPTTAPTPLPIVTNPPTKSPVALPTPSPVISPTSSPQQEQYEQTYSFPPTDTNEFVHGICVMGASSAVAFSDTELDYTVVPEFKDGMNLWSDRDYTAQGIQGDGMCEGGIYLKPSRHKTIARYTDITFRANSIDGNYVSMCVFLNDDDNRDGKWKEVLLSDRFKVSEQFIFTNGNIEGKMRSYCKTIPDPPTSAPSEAPTRTDMDVSYTFPPVQTSQFVHALCVKGVSDAGASSTDSYLSYTSVANFQDGMKIWDDRNYVVRGVEGDAMCEGGIYLRPSRHKSIKRNTIISFEGYSSNGGYVTLCAIIESEGGRRGLWNMALPADGFEVSTEFEWEGTYSGKLRSYCKSIPS